MSAVPLIDIAPLVAGDDGAAGERVGRAIDDACRAVGFFAIVGHGVPASLRNELVRRAREFFEQPDAEKAQIAMARGGRAWRGWFPLDGELTSGHPDHKEGVYFGTELPRDDPRVRAGTPLHGPNLFPAHPAELRAAVLAYLDALRPVADAVMRGIARGLALDDRWFERHLTADPTVLFRIFRYPPRPAGAPGGQDGWGVAEHTDYGLVTILMQDGTAGLQVRTPTGWVDVDAEPDTFVCNIGDMLERMTAGRYRSTPHRVQNTSDGDRLSFPYFFDPGWDVHVVPVPGAEPAAAAVDRWDAADPLTFEGTYGDYLLAKVSKVFPELRSVL